MKEYKCRNCGETNQTLFYKYERGTCKKCRSLLNKERYLSKTPSEKEAYKDYQMIWQHLNLIRYRFLAARYRAKTPLLSIQLSYN